MKKILIVDDDEDFLEWISQGLVHEGYSIFTALTGKEGLDIIKNEVPDVAVIDLCLPDTDGFEICRRIKQGNDADKIAVILVTGVYKEVDAKEKGYSLGADDFLVKPFSYEQLRIRIAKQVQIYAVSKD